MEDNTLTFALPSGRTLAYAIHDPPSPGASTQTIVYLHGFPGSHHEAAVLAPAAGAHDLRIVALSRPGSSLSTPDPRRSIVDYPADVAALADHLGLRRFAVLGVSAGCPYALACWRESALLPRSRLVGIGIVAGAFPLALGTAGMLLESRVLLGVAPWAGWLVAWGMDWQLGRAARDEAHPERFEKLLTDAFKSRPATDRAVLESDPAVRKALVDSTRAATKPGGHGPAVEARLLGSPWGFELGELSARDGEMVLWHGDADVNVPVAMAKKAVVMIPGAELRVSEGESHASLYVNKKEEIARTMKEILSR